MKRIIYTILMVCAVVFATQAQNDTLLYENFSVEFDSVLGDFGAQDGVVQFASGSDTIFVNFDADGIPAANGRPGNWYWDFESLQPEDSLQGGILLSSSWLDGYAPGNRNWLILPPITLGDSSGVFSWKSATYQGPRYMDGYSVIVSTGSNDATTAGNFTDTLFKAASMDAIVGDGASLSIDSFAFTPGYIHADGFTLSSYFLHGDSVGFSAHYGLMEPHSVSLAQYAGQTIYIAIVHDADDDNLIAIDDILVTGTKPVNSSTQSLVLDVDLAVFPNPATDYINLTYEVKNSGEVAVQVIDMTGRTVISQMMNAVSGANQERLSVGNLPAGTYQVILSRGTKRTAQSFVKK